MRKFGFLSGLLIIGFAPCTQATTQDWTVAYSSLDQGFEIHAMALDSTGNVFVAGYYQSNFNAPFDRPVTFMAPGTGSNGGYLTKFAPDGRTPLYSILLPGARVYDLEITGDDEVFICGRCKQGFPVTAGAYDTTFSDPVRSIGFIARIASDGSGLTHATYLGGDTGNTTCYAMDLNPQRRVFVTGRTGASDFPITPGAFNPTQDIIFVSSLSPDLDELVYSTYLGVSTEGGSDPPDIAVDPPGHAYITGRTGSPRFPTTASAFQPSPSTSPGVQAAYLAKLSPDGRSLRYSTYFDDDSTNDGIAVAARVDGHAFIVGGCSFSHSSFPATPNALSTDGNIFIAEFDTFASGADSLVWATKLQSDMCGINSRARAVCVRGTDLYIAGSTDACDLDLVHPTQSHINMNPNATIFSAKSDMFTCIIDLSTYQLGFSTYHGGESRDNANTLAVDANGGIWIGGSSLDAGEAFPLSPNAGITNQRYQAAMAHFSRGTPAIDSDQDGIVDALDPDDDNDGMSDADELVAGTNPLNPNSLLQVVNQALPGAAATEIRYPTVVGRIYSVEGSAGFGTNANWNVLAGPQTGDGTTKMVTVPASEAIYHYRIRVAPMP